MERFWRSIAGDLTDIPVYRDIHASLDDYVHDVCYSCGGKDGNLYPQRQEKAIYFTCLDCDIRYFVGDDPYTSAK